MRKKLGRYSLPGAGSEMSSGSTLSERGSKAAVVRPDFSARLRKIYGNKIMRTSGAELLAQERNAREY
jgi:hypothetical protein